MAHTKLPFEVFVDSRDREYGSLTEFSYKIPQSSETVNGIQIIKVSIPKSYHEIRTGVNDVLNLTELTGPTVINAQITPGTYEASALATHMGTILTTASAGGNAWVYTVTYNASTGRFTFSAGGVNSFTMNWATANAAAAICGFPATNIATATTHTSTNVVDMEPNRNLYLSCGNFGSSVSAGRWKSYCLEIPTTNDDFMQIINYEPAVPKTIPLFGQKTFSDLTFGLYYRDNTAVDLNGLGFGVTIRFI